MMVVPSLHLKIGLLLSALLLLIPSVLLLFRSAFFSADATRKNSFETFAQSFVSVGTMGLGQASATWASDDIPMIIHQQAPADRSRWPATWVGCHETWSAMYPPAAGYKHMMWTDEAMVEFCKQHYPIFYRKMFSKYDKLIKKVDVFRYLVLYHFGGLYADMDYECVIDFWDQLRSGRANVAASAHQGEGLQNALMASPVRHPFWQYVLYEAYQSIREPDVLLSTGPQVVVRAAAFAPPDMVHVLPADKFSHYTSDPTEQGNVVVHMRAERHFVPTSTRIGVYAAHHGTANWT